MAGFQTRINQYPAPGVEGAFAGTNPHATYQAGEGALVAGEDGLTVGRFAWMLTVWLPMPVAVFRLALSIVMVRPRSPFGWVRHPCLSSPAAKSP